MKEEDYWTDYALAIMEQTSIQTNAGEVQRHDWNQDGIISIIGDVPCFVDCVYFDNCPE